LALIGNNSRTILRSGGSQVQGFTAIFGLFAVPRILSISDYMKTLIDKRSTGYGIKALLKTFKKKLHIIGNNNSCECFNQIILKPSELSKKNLWNIKNKSI
jgi:hypothetical protein